MASSATHLRDSAIKKENMTTTPEELQAQLEKAMASIAKLEENNKKLMTQKVEAAREAEEAREAAEAAAEEKARNEKNVEALESSLTKKFEKQIAELTKAKETSEATVKSLLIDGTIKGALADAGVLPEAVEALTFMFKSNVEISGSGAEAKAVRDGVSLTDHIKTYLTGESGKIFLAAPVNSGGGATGGSGQSTGLNANSSLTDILATAEKNPAAAMAAMASKS